MEYQTYKGVVCRKGNRTDRSMINDCIENYKYFNFTPGSVVLDFGANIGGFAHMCKNPNIVQYIGFEADPDNFEVLSNNIPDYGMIYHAAVSHLRDEKLTFHRTPTNQGSCSGTVTPSKSTVKRRSLKYDVLNFYINDLLEMHKPTHLKMDIEGTEFEWFESNDGKIPEYINEFALEIHNHKKIYKFVELWYNSIVKDFDIVNVAPEVGFRNGVPFEVPELGIKEEKGGTMWGVDIFMRRK